MASTNVDGRPMMILSEGAHVVIVIGERSYQGTLQMRRDGFNENWEINLTNAPPGEPDGIQIHKVKTDEAPAPRVEPEGSN